jgi:hypothetical protein
MTNHCGSCTACCRVFDIPQLSKPAGKWCQHCDIGKGCKIYDDRPKPCVEFECLYFQSQKRENPSERLPLSLRPDNCKVVFAPSTNEEVLAALTMPGSPTAWRRSDVRNLIDKIVKHNNMAVVCGAARSTRRTLVAQDGEHDVYLTEPDENGIQYNIPEAKEQAR